MAGPPAQAQSTLLEIWARVLEINPSEIEPDDSFFSLGGDSVTAMRVVALARQEGHHLATADIFRNPNITALSHITPRIVQQFPDTLEPFELLVDNNSPAAESLRHRLAGACNVSPTLLVDAYPSTPLQEGLLALTTKSPEAYILKSTLELFEGIDIDRFRKACDEAAHFLPILRTRLVQDDEAGLVQAVIDEPISWRESDNLEEYLEEDGKMSMLLGQPLMRFGLVTEPDTSVVTFVWTVHHALYDGQFIVQVLEIIDTIYRGDEKPAIKDFNFFVRYANEARGQAAKDYWAAAMTDFNSELYPPAPRSQEVPQPKCVQQHHITLPPIREPNITTATLMRAAWALTASASSGVPDIVFGAIVSGRQGDVPNIEEIAGPTIATVPVRVQIDYSQTISEYLKQVQTQSIDMIRFEQTGLHYIRSITSDTRAACNFQTLLILQPSKLDEETAVTDSELGIWECEEATEAFATYALNLTCVLEKNSVRVEAVFDESRLGKWEVSQLLERLNSIASQLASYDGTKTIADVSLLAESDYESIWSWNRIVPEAIEKTVHSLVERHVATRPNSPAICSWDGELTFRQLDSLATRLAARLVELGVGPEVLVPLCFEKSMWTPVAMLAVLKAGGAFTPLDPAQPIAHLQTIVNQTQAPVMLCSCDEAPRWSDSTADDTTIFVVSTDWFAQNPETHSSAAELLRAAKQPATSSPAYVVFTSGSTGTPKGVIVTHGAFASAITHQASALGYLKATRTFDFASYAFDMAAEVAFFALGSGVCLCVPSDAQRKGDVAGALKAFGVDHAKLTPSVSRTIDWSELQSINTLLLGGEEVRKDDVTGWGQQIHAINTYGPTECTPCCNIQPLKLTQKGQVSMGRPIGAVTWVADATDHTKLAPVGALGELFIEGPIVGRGYLNNPDKTAAAFIDSPPWLLQGAPGYPGRHGRLYKTGDLVRYTEDGSLVFVARKDTQAKIRGQRVELSEVERYVQANVPGAGQVAAEIIIPSGDNDANPMLAAFIVREAEREENDGGENNGSHAASRHVNHDTSNDVKRYAACVMTLESEVENLLAEHLPLYMIPSIFFIIDMMPVNTSGKTDRKKLKVIGASFTAKQLIEMRVDNSQPKQVPSTDKERLMQQVWARALHIDPATIGVNDSFFNLGGDSVSAMKMVALAHRLGHELTVADVFRHPKLGVLASKAVKAVENASDTVGPFTLLDKVDDKDTLRKRIASFCDVADPNMVLDAYPCTPLQEGLLAITSKSPDAYIMYSTFELYKNVDVARFRHAWNQVACRLPILRTRIMQDSEAGLVQVVLDEVISWRESNSVESYFKEEREIPMLQGQPLMRFGLVTDPTGKSTFVWTLHHALYDGYFIVSVFNLLNSLYKGAEETPTTKDFNLFIRYAMRARSSAGMKYWESTMAGFCSQLFPAAVQAAPVVNSTKQLQVALPSIAEPNITMATLMRAAWALTASMLSGTLDVVFGGIVSGRQGGVANIEDIAGPTIATVPIRVQIDKKQTISAYLQHVQAQAIDMIPYEQTGLQNIQTFTPDARAACNFQTVLLVQPQELDDALLLSESELGVHRCDEDVAAFATYALNLTCLLGSDSIKIEAAFDNNRIGEWEVSQLLQRFTSIASQLASSNAHTVADIDLLLKSDYERVWSWNANVPEAANQMVHWLVERQAAVQPDSIAVDAWDGSFSYGELDLLADKLVPQLRAHGVGPEVIVPLCFEKSRWTIVAMLATLKTGGAFSLLDPSQPASRLRGILNQTLASVLLCSSQEASRWSGTEDLAIITVNSSLLSSQEVADTLKPCQKFANLDSAAYVIFTSGSTGTPKGVIITHRAFSSAILHQAGPMGYSAAEATRVFDFASHTFDMAVEIPFFTLASGLCLCVPSDSERKGDLTQTLNTMAVDFLKLTPSVARLIDRNNVPTVKSLILSGEEIREDDIAGWPGVRVLTNYGPAECSPVSTIESREQQQKGISIGYGAGGATWIVDPNDVNQLSPVGVVGELCIEGPIVGRGYLQDDEKTADLFINDPVWLTQGGANHPGRRGRIYKTGDLVRYQQDGSLIFVGRKDTQVKIRGQRVELGEVESHTLACIPGAIQVAAEVITPSGNSGNSGKPILAAFVASTAADVDGDEARVITLPPAVEDALAERLLSFMVPAVFFAVHAIPITGSGKMDRRRLKAIGAAFSEQQLVDLRSESTKPKKQPSTNAQRALQQLWALVLNRDPVAIGLEDSFFRLGGDSIAAMNLVALARREGHALSAADIFRSPQLAPLALIMAEKADARAVRTANQEVARFSLLTHQWEVESLCKQAAVTCQVESGQIEDAYPCTPLQEGVLAMTAISASAYIQRNIQELASNVNLASFRNAWTETARRLPILRTRVIEDSRQGLLQVVIDEDIEWIHASGSVQNYVKMDSVKPMALGQRLARYALVTEASGRTWFVWTMHHALYDGHMLGNLYSLVTRLYTSQNLTSGGHMLDFKVFAKYMAGLKSHESVTYWRDALAGYDAEPFPAPLPATKQGDHTTRNYLTVERRSAVKNTSRLGITIGSLIRGAWALTAAAATGDRDVVFGAIVSGRQADIAGIDAIAGPTVATVPIRMRISYSQTVGEFLQGIQGQATDMIAHEQAGLQHIQKTSTDARKACKFQTLLITQPPDDAILAGSDEMGRWEAVENSKDFTNYALNLSCVPEDNGSITIQAAFDTDYMNVRDAGCLLERFESHLHQLAAAPTTQILSSIDALSQSDHERIWSWNDRVPKTAQKTLHALIEEQATTRPEAIAINAWDGDLTYGQLNLLASRLATKLTSLGVGPDVFVPLFFEKSRWAAMAMLAILKAGGAFAPLDPDQAAARRERALEQTGASVIVASTKAASSLAIVPGRTVIAVDLPYLEKLNAEAEQFSSATQMGCPAYVIFTSGSTGQPKGVVVEQGAIATSCLSHGEYMGFNERSRVLQYSPYTFDVSIMDTMTTLVFGGCVCVPTVHQRDDDLVGTIRDFNISMALLPPVAARLLDPKSLPSLETVVMGADMSTDQDFARWHSHVRVLHGYGPTECAICCAMTEVVSSKGSGRRIGRPLGCMAWITLADNSDVLAPPGAIGELLVEGPILARGYLHDEAQTATAFVEDPPWLLRGGAGRPGRRGRLYKTGDLVRYDMNEKDASLIFIGRKDTQVKVRGQRVELGEVEHHMKACVPNMTQVVAEVIRAAGDDCPPFLAAFVVTTDQGSEVNLMSNEARVITLPLDVEDALAKRLPSYMIPTTVFAMARMPVIASGKVDRKRLRFIGASFTEQQLAEMRRQDTEQEKKEPQTEAERALQHIFARVLNLDPDSIGVNDSFFRLGGDSITAMQASAAARATLGNISTADVLRRKTIAELASLLPSSGASQEVSLSSTVPAAHQTNIKLENTTFDLSPIQKFFFDLEPNPRRPFDQSFFLRLRMSMPLALFRMAFQTLISTHPMLRARFTRSGRNIWQQYISEDIAGSFHFNHVKGQELTEQTKAEAIIQCRSRIDIEKGPLLAAALFDEGSGRQSLFLALHHLVVDLVSWRIILQDLEELLTTGNISVPPTTSFPAWCMLQDNHSAQNRKAETSLATNTNMEAPLSYWGLDRNAIVSKATSTAHFTVDKVITAALFGPCNQAFETHSVELLVAALVYSFGLAFPERETPTIFSEGHGRHAWDCDSEIDASRIVGWFTSIFPVISSNVTGSTIVHAVRMVKDSWRRLADHGRAYLATGFSDERAAQSLSSSFPAEIAFNYTGRYQQLERKDSVFDPLDLPDKCTLDAAGSARRFALFEVVATIEHECLTVDIVYPSNSLHQDKIAAFIRGYQDALELLVTELDGRAEEKTLADMPMGFRSYDDLDTFRRLLMPRLEITESEIEDIYPCSDVQEVILLAQAKDETQYKTTFAFDIRATSNSPRIECDRAQRAWRAVVRRHSLLRALLISDFPGQSKPVHVILKDPEPRVRFLRSTESGNVKDMVPWPPRFGGHDLEHSLHIIDESGRGEVIRLRLDISHSIIDGHSGNILLNDFCKAYDGDLDPKGPLYRKFVEHMKGESAEADAEYWKNYLKDVKPCFVPGWGGDGDEEGDDTKGPLSEEVPGINTKKMRQFCAEWESTPSAVIQTAWALVLQELTGSTSPCFGMLTSGRDVPVSDVNGILGPFIGFIPCRVDLNEDHYVKDILEKVQQCYLDSLPHQSYPLMRIRKDLEVDKEGLFNSFMSLQTKEKSLTRTAKNGHVIQPIGGQDTVEFDIALQVSNGQDAIAIEMEFKRDLFGKFQAKQIAAILGKAIDVVMSGPKLRVQQLKLEIEEDADHLWTWNASVPEAAEGTVHSLIEERVAIRPNAAAISAWDGDLTYGELDALAGRLATRLKSHGIGPEQIVPLCFKKSQWTAVSVLAVLKAGGAFSLLETSQPTARLCGLIEQTQAKVMLCSSDQAARWSDLDGTIALIVVDSTLQVPEVNDMATLDTKSANSDSAAYVVFTSGSTGTPKGVVIPHRAFYSAIAYQAAAMGFHGEARVFDFAAYAFDVSVSNLLMTLTAGGCLCVPSEDDRKNDLSGIIASFRTTTVELTPSVARAVDPERLEGIETLILGGEPVRSKDLVDWPLSMRILNTYGPAECTPTSTINTETRGASHATSIGRGAGAVTWVVDPADANRLVPVGFVGELCIEGPIISRGYLHDEKKTAEAFINDPPWLVQGRKGSAGRAGHPGRRGRLYKTGDLVRYNEDGTLVFVGRKDAQVKVRGQRVELGEVEHHIKACVPGVMQAAADLITPKGSRAGPVLAAFVVMSGEPSAAETGTAGSNRISVMTLSSDVEDALAERLPSYMIPTTIFTLDRMPENTSSKTDHKKLQAIGASFTAQQLMSMGADRQPKKATSTDTEHTLQGLWAHVLGLEQAAIGAEDNFFRLGGDSIAAMKLVAVARRDGYSLSVADIFKTPKLAALALVVDVATESGKQLAGCANERIATFSLLPQPSSIDRFREHVAKSCGIKSSQVQDAYPCTPLQEGLLAMTSISATTYIQRSVYKLDDNFQLDRFQRAWVQVVRRLDILRTRIVEHIEAVGQRLLQIVVDEDIEWNYASNLQEYNMADSARPMSLGQKLTRFALVTDPSSGSVWFVLTMHHAIYDGHFLNNLRGLVVEYYRSGSGCIAATQETRNFKLFAKYLASLDSNQIESYWRDTLAGYDAEPFPPTPLVKQTGAGYGIVERQCRVQSIVGLGITLPSHIRAAWALAIAAASGNRDVIFGAVVSGRNAHVHGIDTIAGPTIASVPVRVKVSHTQTVHDFLRGVQEQSVNMIPYEQAGLQYIRKVSAAAKRACQFQTLLVTQPPDEASLASSDSIGTWVSGEDSKFFTSYALNMNCFQEGDDTVSMLATYNTEYLDEQSARLLLERFESCLVQLAAASASETQRLRDIDMLLPSDYEKLWRWNLKLPRQSDKLVHSLVEDQAEAQPEAAAISAWDGDLTYRELNKLAGHLASRLISIGAGPKMIIPLCFEKSRWTTVAMLAVLKAGAAFTLLDSSQPTTRLIGIIRQTNANLMLCSSNEALRWTGPDAVVNVITVNSDLFARQKALDAESMSRNMEASLESPAYVVFTSGSTGTPKGVVISHKAFSSAILHQTGPMGYTSTSRVFDFASHAFDMAIEMPFFTLASGACLCVPSDTARKSDLTQAIKAFKIDHLKLTPSVARLIDRKKVGPALRTLILSGEEVRKDDISGWGEKTRVITNYGPAECSPVSTVEPRDQKKPDKDVSIGYGCGAVTWVVDAGDIRRLAPVGVVGELLIEGPLVGLGYLGRKEKTAQAFIENPAWLLGGYIGYPGRHGRLYKTNDLVRYQQDGSLVFVGRKDTQVKIRGQRVELGEVENHTLACVPRAIQVAAEVITPAGSANPMLAAFVVRADEAGHEARVINLPAAAEDALAARLPSYMVPAVFFALNCIPVSSGSGKTDRGKLRAIGADFTEQQLVEMGTDTSQTKKPPSTDAERSLQKIWAQVLNLKPESIGIDDSFFRLGGDSITAMKVSTSARATVGNISSGDIMKKKTISRLLSGLPALAHHSANNASADDQEDQVDEVPFNLSPIQRLYFQVEPDPRQPFHQSCLLRLRGMIPQAFLKMALETIVSRHPMLRARFIKGLEENCWQQYISNDVLGSFYLHHAKCPEAQQKAQTITQCLNRLNIVTGPLLASVLFEDEDGQQSLFIAIHHLVIDLVSWRILLEDLEELLSNGGLSSPSTMSFPTWCSMQENHAAKYLEVEASTGPTSYSYWLLEKSEIVSNATATHRFTLDQATTAAIFRFDNPTSESQPLEVLVGALAYSFGLSFPDREIPTIFREGHGREAWDDEIDVSHTVGWFTTIFPGLNSDVRGLTLDHTIQRVKDSWRNLADNGWAYFTSRFASNAAAEAHAPGFPAEITFNYTGRYQQLERSQSMFKPMAMPVDCMLTGATRRLALFEFVAVVEGDCLRFDITYPKHAAYQDRIESWMKTYEDSLVLQASQSDGRIRLNGPIHLNGHSGVNGFAKLDGCGQAHEHDHSGTHDDSYGCTQSKGQAKLNGYRDRHEIVTDLERIWFWNAKVPSAVNKTVHSLVEDQVAARPEATAIHAWDGDLTYGKLDQLASQLAVELKTSFGVGPEIIVPLCFEKSRWTAVSVLAVLKAGGAFTLLEPSQPIARLRIIVEQIHATVILCSPNEAPRWSGSNAPGAILTIGPDWFLNKAENGPGSLLTTCAASAESAAYVVFTSGSTGIPKGVIVTHGAFSSATTYQAKLMGFQRSARVFDFASYTFDVSISNILMTLSSGACLCVPSEEERMYDFAGSIRRLNANMAHLTPSVSRTFAADVMQHLDTVLLIGEPVRNGDAQLWPESTRVINTYGPAECSPVSTIEPRDQRTRDDASIGYGAGAVTWVVNSDNANQLLPVGDVGELCIEGPIVGRGYLHDKDKTAAAFIDNPTFLTQGCGAGQSGRRGRLYKTGDLVRYNQDGSLVFISRKDNQVKIHGQRVELGEVESYTLASIPDVAHIAAEMITPGGPGASPMLVAFLVLSDSKSKVQTDSLGASTDSRKGARIITLSPAAKTALAERVPSFMIPAAFLAVEHLPVNSSSKIDRKKLREIGGFFSVRELRRRA